MSPEESIKRLEEIKAGKKYVFFPLSQDALGLGIEALKLNKSMRETYAHPELLVLAGETKEEHET
ncbi:hypothetical protein ES703_69325 [subsurface metagenome]